MEKLKKVLQWDGCSFLTTRQSPIRAPQVSLSTTDGLPLGDAWHVSLEGVR